MESYKDALEALNQVLDIHSKHIKALYIKGKVLLLMGETQDAIISLNKSLDLDPNNVEVRKELKKAQDKHKIQYQNEKKLYKKMMSGVVESTKLENELLLKSKTSLKNKNDATYKTLIAAGLALALVSVGIALYTKYRN